MHTHGLYLQLKCQTKLEGNGIESNQNGLRTRLVPKDWWVEDLCELEVDLYKSVITNIKSKAVQSNEVIGEALKAYAYRRLPNFSKGMIQCGDVSSTSRTS